METELPLVHFGELAPYPLPSHMDASLVTPALPLSLRSLLSAGLGAFWGQELKVLGSS